MTSPDELPPPPPYSVHDPHGAPSNQVQRKSKSPIEKRTSENKDDEPLFISGTAYFAMHPFTPSRKFPLLTYHLPLLQDASADSVNFPGTESIQRQRNLTGQDWQAFLNHMILQQPERARASRCEDADARENENTRRSRIKAVTSEWNDGFFGPRGLHIILEIAARSRLDSKSITSNRGSSSVSKGDAQASSDESIGLALYHAATKGNSALVQTLLDSGASASIRPSCAKPGLTRAIENSDWHIVQMLLERGGPDLEATAPAGETALYTAVSKGDEKLVELLLKHGADVRAKPPGGEPVLYKATSKGFIEIVRILLESDHIDVDATPPGGSPSLYRAYEKGYSQLIELLLKKGSNPNLKPPGGATAMYKAASKGDISTALMMLEYGADPDATPPGGNTALYNAASKGQEEIARVLLDYGADVGKKASGSNSALWVAADHSNKGLTRLLLERGAVVDATPWGGNTALWRAAKRDDIPIASVLLQHGANPDEKTMGNETALMIAASKGNIHMARLLIDHGADPHMKVGSETPLSRAAKKGHHDVAEMMMKLSASSRTSKPGYT
ncbi:MAG: hypothetical protein Q9195_004534 [Heterodermia aff. obscurata]